MPVGYADDLAACCLDHDKLKRSMEVVHAHGRTWRYDFNAKKSGVLVFGESKRENARNRPGRSFMLGTEKVPEKAAYEHVGVKLSIFKDDVSGVEERLAKARRALNAISGLGIRKNGLTIASCSILFWTIIVPIATFGSELWILNDKVVKLLEEFQNFVGKKIQRLFPKSPNSCAYYGLGWLRLERFIEVKKILFLRSLLCIDDGTINTIMLRCTQNILANPVLCQENLFLSPVYDLLNTASTFGCFNDAQNMILNGHHWSKSACRDKIWIKAWQLEDVFWCIRTRCHQSLALLNNVCSSARYIIWWQLADVFYDQMRNCEIMVKLLCRASLLKVDDVRLKRLPANAKFCSLCDLGAYDDANHMIMQCPSTKIARNNMFDELQNVHDGTGHDMLNAGNDIFLTLMGRQPPGFSTAVLVDFWLIAAKHIAAMYRRRMKIGIG